ncbi:hypothetical protein D770_04865 [Flammeovirgaceae bacterium 311]|nr:hypothetical protein D770_04865 [Flammeovirgaceae bacterium 311]
MLDEINIVKLITDEEISAHQDFFEQCAKDYRILSQKLITALAKELKVEIKPDYPLETLNPYRGNPCKQSGVVNGWRYFFHGFHCGFINLKTGQSIETPLTFGLEFGVLDPYFFSIYIKSTKEYHPSPIQVYSDFEDGRRILKKMLELGKFEKINSNHRGDTGVVVKDRDRIEVKINKHFVEPISNTDFKIKEPSTEWKGNSNFWSRLKRLWS